MIRVVLVEDSPVQRELLTHVLEQAGGFVVVGTAADGLEAVSAVDRLRPDVVLMDFNMPILDGIEATRRIMERCPTPIVVCSASLVASDVKVTFDAVAAGALAVLAKPTAPDSESYAQLADHLTYTLRLMAGVKVVRQWPKQPRTDTSPPFTAPVVPPAAARIVAIAGSTGAPNVIATILSTAGPGMRVPVVMVQHLAAGFMDGFAAWLTQKTGLSVRIAGQGMQIEAGSAYLAPDGAHMGVEAGGRLTLSSAPLENGFRPSASALFRSVARSYGPAALGVLLTGMGRDGADGLLELRQAGAITVAQDEASSTVFGMPGEAIRLGAALHVLSPDRIGTMLASCGSERARKKP